MKNLAKNSTAVFWVPALYFLAGSGAIWAGHHFLTQGATSLTPQAACHVAMLLAFVLVMATALLLTFVINKYVYIARTSKSASRRMLTRINQANRRRKQVANELDAILNNSLVGILFVDGSLVVRRVNAHFRDLMGREAEWFADRHVSDLNGLASWLEEAIGDCGQPGRHVDLECHAQLHGRMKWLRISVRMLTPTDKVNGHVVVVRDITRAKLDEERIAFLSYYDCLTGLPNRRLFRERMAEACRKAARYGQRFCVLFLDMNNFKEYNDQHGHAFGDQVLREFARVVAGCLRETDVLARLGGDEFAVLLGQVDGSASPEAVSEKIGQRLRRVEEVDGKPVSMSASIGFALCPEDGMDMDALLNTADQRMYLRKRLGKMGRCALLALPEAMPGQDAAPREAAGV